MRYKNLEELSKAVPASFEIIHSEELKDIECEGLILKHKKSGARVSLLSSEDDNKLFCIAFRTPPEDACGTPHIIEHTVLCGSERFPVKDPFMQLEKGSLNTFLNAMTYPDKTLYPVSSCNDKDFSNLMNVYLDAVFAPNIYHHKEIFMQEGWHYEPNRETGEIEINGVVYSEMKGATSSPDNNIYNDLMHEMYPDTPYGKNSGGDPEFIPQLTYEKYLDFHRKYYHPSNSYIMLYGDMDMTERLEYLDREYLSKYDKADIPSEINSQSTFGKTVRREGVYPISEGDDTENAAYLAYAATVADSSDPVECYAWSFLDEILLNDPGAPVKEALNKAEIGQDVFGGFEDHLRDPMFCIISKNTNASNADKFEKIIKDTLKETVKKGINKKSLLSSIERSEFRFREGHQGAYSSGLDYFLEMLQYWIYHEEDPFSFLRISSIYKRLRELAETDYFDKLAERLAEPQHGLVYTLLPEAGLNEKNAEKLKGKMREFRSSMSDDEFASLCDEFDAFREYQDEEDEASALATIPVLTRDDIKKETRPLYNREGTIGGLPAVIHDIPTSGITVLKLLFDISHIPEEDLPYLDLLTELYGELDTKNYSYSDLNDEIKMNIGSLEFGYSVTRKFMNPEDFTPYFAVTSRFLENKADVACDIISEVIKTTSFSNYSKIKDILSETVSDIQRTILQSGHKYAIGRVASYMSVAAAYTERAEGIDGYLKQKKMLEDYNGKEISERLSSVADRIFLSDNVLVSVAPGGDTEKIDKAVKKIADVLSKEKKGKRADFTLIDKHNEGFMTSSQVQYIAQVGSFTDFGHKYSGAMEVLASAVKNDYLYPEIRMKGGAYSYSCMVNYSTGNLTMLTYRDPCLKESLDTFAKVKEFIKNMAPDETELDKYVIGTFAKSDAPITPAQNALRSLLAYLSGRTYENLQKTRDEMINVTRDELRSLADAFGDAVSQNNYCVIGAEAKIKENSELFNSIEKLS